MLSATAETASRRAREYWNVDGLPEILCSGIMLLLGFWALVTKLSAPLWLQRLSDIAFFITLLSSFLCRRVLDWLKARVTYPRTGYAPPPLSPDEVKDARWQAASIRTGPATPSRARMALWLPLQDRVFPAGLLGILILEAMHLWPFRWAPLILATAAALAFRSAHGNPEFPFHSITLWSLPMAGLMLSVLDVPTPTRVGWALLAFSSVGLIAGTITFWSYLRQHPSSANCS